jgi:selenocysteine lyase/cysteine desulfurase
VTFQKQGLEAADIAKRLATKAINVSVTTLPYAQLDLRARGLSSLVRASVHYFNTDNEIDRFAEAIKSI